MNAYDHARQLATDAATDIEFGDIGDHLAAQDDIEDLTAAQFDALQTKISDLLGRANVTVTWDDEPLGGEG